MIMFNELQVQMFSLQASLHGNKWNIGTVFNVPEILQNSNKTDSLNTRQV